MEHDWLDLALNIKAQTKDIRELVTKCSPQVKNMVYPVLWNRLKQTEEDLT